MKVTTGGLNLSFFFNERRLLSHPLFDLANNMLVCSRMLYSIAFGEAD